MYQTLAPIYKGNSVAERGNFWGYHLLLVKSKNAINYFGSDYYNVSTAVDIFIYSISALINDIEKEREREKPFI